MKQTSDSMRGLFNAEILSGVIASFLEGVLKKSGNRSLIYLFSTALIFLLGKQPWFRAFLEVMLLLTLIPKAARLLQDFWHKGVIR